MHLLPTDLIMLPSPFAAPHLPEWVHAVCVTGRLQAMLDDFVSVRKGDLVGDLGRNWDAKFIWEPLGVSTLYY
jgi:hypothetical protein